MYDELDRQADGAPDYYSEIAAVELEGQVTACDRGECQHPECMSNWIPAQPAACETCGVSIFDDSPECNDPDTHGWVPF